MRRMMVLLMVFTGALPAQHYVPPTYTITEDPGFPLAGPSVVKVSRDGSKEVVDQVMPAGPGRDKEYHGHLLYDFQAHKLYTKIVSEPDMPCGIQDYAEPQVPAEFDPVSGSEALMKELTSGAQMKQTGTESVNGIPAKVMAVTSATASAKIWLAQNGAYPLKIVVVEPDGKAMTMIEVKQLSFMKPPASTFALPAGCEAVKVETPSKPGPNVTALTLEKIPDFKGACPAHLKLTGTITVDSPGTVFYQFGAGKMETGETLVFSAAGTKTVTHTITLQPVYGNDMGGGAILEAIGVDAGGNHGPPTKGSNNSSFNVTCTSGGGK